MAEQSESKCPSSFSSLNLANLKKQLEHANSLRSAETPAYIREQNQSKSAELVNSLKKLLENANPTIAEALEVVKAFLLLNEGALYMRYPKRLGPLPEGCKVTITQKGPYFCELSLTKSDGTIEQKHIVIPGRDSLNLGDVKMYKISSGKLDIDSISDENIKKVVNELKKQWDQKKGFSEYYFKTYVVQFLNGETFAVVDNMLHFN